MGSHPPISISLPNDRFFLLSPARFCKNPLIPFSSASSPTPFFIFPNSNSVTACPIFAAKPLLCRAASTADTKTLPKSAIKRIAEKLRSLGYGEDDTDKGSPPPETNNKSENDAHGYSPGELFVPLPTQLPKYRVGHTLDPSWSTPENPVPLPGAGKAIQKNHQLRVGAINERIEERSKQKREKHWRSLPCRRRSLGG